MESIIEPQNIDLGQDLEVLLTTGGYIDHIINGLDAEALTMDRNYVIRNVNTKFLDKYFEVDYGVYLSFKDVDHVWDGLGYGFYTRLRGDWLFGFGPTATFKNLKFHHVGLGFYFDIEKFY